MKTQKSSYGPWPVAGYYPRFNPSKLFSSISLIFPLLLFGLSLSAQQNCNSVTDPVTGCNILYCDGSTCTDLVPASGVFTCTSCMPCGVASPPSDKYACARVELDLTGTTEYANDPTLSGCSLPVSTQENGNFDIYIVDGFIDCGNPDFVIGDGGSLPINIITGGMVELIICKTGNAGRRDMNIMLSCCDPVYTCTLADIDEEGCDPPPAFTNINDVFDISCGTGTGLTMNHMDVGDTDVCGDATGADFVRTYSLFNAAGNLVASCDQHIIIEDITPPVVTCPVFEDTFFECPDGLGPGTPGGDWEAIGPDGSINVATAGSRITTLDLSNCVSDNCADLADLEWTLADSYTTDFLAGCRITIRHELFLRDECHNVADDRIILDVTIENTSTSPPSIDCPSDATVECGGSTDPMDTGMPSGSTNCGEVVFTFDDNFDPGGCGSGTGVIARTWTATSGCGVTNTCVQIINIVDTTPPNINCPSDVTVECGDDTSPTSTGMATGSDDCGGVNFDFSDDFDPACGNTGTITRTWLAVDDCGVTNTCQQIITIIDTTPPSIICPSDVTVECGDDTSPNSTGQADTGSGICGGIMGITFEDDFTPGCGSGTGIITRTWKVTDACGVMNTCDQIITIVDITPPNIDCPGDRFVNCGDDTSPAALGMAVGNDNCGGVMITFEDEFTPTCQGSTGSGSGIITRTWKATDGCGLMTTCEQVITVEDDIPPSIDCPADRTVNCGDDTSPNSMGMATGSDNCGGVMITFSDQFDPSCTGTGTAAGTIVRTWKATDDCGLMNTCQQIITIVDTPPMINCPADVTIECDEDGSPANTGMATGSDDCGGVNITFTDSFQSDCPTSSGTGTGVVTRTWKATDDCGQMTTCDQIITIVDNTPPVISTPPGSLDVTIDLTDPALCPTGFVSATCYFSSDPNFPISVDVSVDGVFLGNFPGPDPADISDNCELGLVSCAFANFVQDDCITTFDVVWTAQDVCGVNFSDPFTQSFTLLDKVAPVFDLDCQLDLVFTTENGNVCPADAEISLNEGDVIDVNTGWTVGGVPIDPLSGCVEDNCVDDDDLLIIVDDITVTGDDCERVITVTFLADDGCGNMSDPFVCVYTFIDDTPPVVNYMGLPDGSTITEECNLRDPNWNPFPPTEDLTIFDNCADFGDLIIEMEEELVDEGECGVDDFKSLWRCTWTVTDPCDNVTVYTLFIRIVDTQGPFWTFFPEDENIECDEEVPFQQATALDNCSELDITYNDDIIPGDCMGNYTIRRRWTAVDNCGNPTVDDQLINVTDNTPPEILLIDEYVSDYTNGQEIYADCGDFSKITKLDYAARAFDNCSGEREVEFSYEDFGLFDCAEFGYMGHLVTHWTASDDCGNTSTTTLYWYLTDTTPPSFQGFPEDDCVSSLPPVPNVTAVDDCEFAVVEFSESDPIDCDGGQYVERTWTATDVCGNSISATQRLTLSDGDGPTVSIDIPGLAGLPSGSTGTIDADCNDDGSLNIPDLLAAVSIGDGCSASGASRDLVLIDEGDCATTGYLARYALRVEARDVCGNANSYELFVEVVDNTPPAMSGAAEIIVGCGEAIPEISATDLCSGVVDIDFIDSEPIEASCPDSPRNYERVWRATDGCGNTSVFAQSITVLDEEGPVFRNVPADACNNTSIDEPVVAYDECSNTEVSVQMSESTENVSGCGQVLTRTWTATDACGNTSTATQQVFFTDATAPVLSFAHPLLVGLNDGDELILPIDFDFGNPQEIYDFGDDAITVDDNCASNLGTVLSVIYLDEAEDCAATGYLSRIHLTWTATDPCGNSSKISIILIYEDTYGPEIFGVPADLILYCVDRIPEPTELSAKDNYDGPVPVYFSQEYVSTSEGVRVVRTWTATDGCGNITTVTQNIDIIDNTLTCEFDHPEEIFCNTQNNFISVIAGGGTPPYTYSWEMPDCDGFITSDPTLGTVIYTIGYTTQNFSVTITDANGCHRVCTTSIVCEKEEEVIGFQAGEQMTDELRVYPNPADGQILVQAPQWDDQPLTVLIYSLLGQEMYRQSFEHWPGDGLRVNTQNYPEGTYLIRVESMDREPIAKQMIIQHR